MSAELAALRDDVGPTYLSEPASVEETAERHVRPALRQAFVDMCRGSVGAYLDRWGFRSQLLQAMYAVTDGFSGLSGGWDTPGTGANFLLHNMCRLPGAGGTWMVVEGGMGTVTQRLAAAAMQAGARIQTGVAASRWARRGGSAGQGCVFRGQCWQQPAPRHSPPVHCLSCSLCSIIVEDGAARGVVTADGTERRARQAVLVNADPFRLRTLAGGEAAFSADFNARLDNMRRDGTTMKASLQRAAPVGAACR